MRYRFCTCHRCLAIRYKSMFYHIYLYSCWMTLRNVKIGLGLWMNWVWSIPFCTLKGLEFKSLPCPCMYVPASVKLSVRTNSKEKVSRFRLLTVSVAKLTQKYIQNVFLRAKNERTKKIVVSLINRPNISPTVFLSC